jgi:hypothetical protein
LLRAGALQHQRDAIQSKRGIERTNIDLRLGFGTGVSRQFADWKTINGSGDAILLRR